MYTIYSKDNISKKFVISKNIEKNSWIHSENSFEQDVREISEIIGIEYEDIADSLDIMEIARIENISDTLCAMYLRFPLSSIERNLYTATLTVIFSKSKNLLITITPMKCLMVKKLIESYSCTKDCQYPWLEILTNIVQDYTKSIKLVRTIVGYKEKTNMNQFTDYEISELTNKEEQLNQYITSLQPLQSVIEDMHKYITLSQNEKELVNDLVLSMAQSKDLCKISIRMIAGLRDSLQIMMTNQFNRTIRLLTALTIILNLPTTIASIYGMNIQLPLEDHRYAFPIIMGFIICLSIMMFFVFKKKKWI